MSCQLSQTTRPVFICLTRAPSLSTFDLRLLYLRRYRLAAGSLGRGERLQPWKCRRSVIWHPPAKTSSGSTRRWGTSVCVEATALTLGQRSELGVRYSNRELFVRSVWAAVNAAPQKSSVSLCCVTHVKSLETRLAMSCRSQDRSITFSSVQINAPVCWVEFICRPTCNDLHSTLTLVSAFGLHCSNLWLGTRCFCSGIMQAWLENSYPSSSAESLRCLSFLTMLRMSSEFLNNVTLRVEISP